VKKEPHSNQKKINAKVIEGALCCALFPNIMKDVLCFQPSIAYPVGIFIGFVVAYWLPPIIRPPEGKFSFLAWLGIALAVSVGYWLLRTLIVLLWNML
jgi:hypothetical protein